MKTVHEIDSTDPKTITEILKKIWKPFFDIEDEGASKANLQKALKEIPTINKNLSYIDWSELLNPSMEEIVTCESLGLFKKTQPFLFEHLASNGFLASTVLNLGTSLEKEELYKHQAYIPEIKKHYPDFDVNSMFFYGVEEKDAQNGQTRFKGDYLDEGLMGIAIMGEHSDFMNVLFNQGAHLYNSQDLGTFNIFNYVSSEKELKILLNHDENSFIKSQFFKDIQEFNSHPGIKFDEFNPDDYLTKGSFSSIRISALNELYPIIEETLPKNIDLTQWHYNTITHYDFLEMAESKYANNKALSLKGASKYLCSVIKERPEVLDRKIQTSFNFYMLQNLTIKDFIYRGAFPDVVNFIEQIETEKKLKKALSSNIKQKSTLRF